MTLRSEIRPIDHSAVWLIMILPVQYLCYFYAAAKETLRTSFVRSASDLLLPYSKLVSGLHIPSYIFVPQLRFEGLE